MERDLKQTLSAFDRGELSRRELGFRLMALGAAAAGVAPSIAQAEQNGGSTFEATSLDHIALNVSDIGRSVDFYQQHLGMTIRSRGNSSAFLNCGRDWVALFRRGEPGMDHYCYAIRDYDPDEAVAKLEEAGLEPTRRANRVYFPDPDGITVQIAAETDA